MEPRIDAETFKSLVCDHVAEFVAEWQAEVSNDREMTYDEWLCECFDLYTIEDIDDEAEPLAAQSTESNEEMEEEEWEPRLSSGDHLLEQQPSLGKLSSSDE